MPRFSYTAIGMNGKGVRGIVTAESPYSARKQLRSKRIHPTSIKEVSSTEQQRAAFMAIFRRRGKKQILEFTQQMATLLGSGIKLTEAISVMTIQITDSEFKDALIDIRDRVISGESFADTLGDYPDYFDIIYVSMIRVGEVTGSLHKSLATIGNFMEKRQRVESRVVTAMVYPAILMIFCFGVIILLTTMVIPKIATQIARTGQELPWITKRLMDFSYILTSWWVFVVVGVVAGVVWLLKRFLRTERGAYLKDKFVLWLPIFGPLMKQRVVARFASTLSTLLGSGLSMAEALRVVAEVTGNTIMNRAVKQARERILSGADIATPLRESGVISPAIAHMVSVGEKSGELETMLSHISENLEAKTDLVIERLSVALEPIIIVVMAFIIGVIAYATILPILEVSAGKF
ncbi:MAG: type II secretion system F family protein [Planctomycetota bacterium]